MTTTVAVGGGGMTTTLAAYGGYAPLRPRHPKSTTPTALMNFCAETPAHPISRRTMQRLQDFRGLGGAVRSTRIRATNEDRVLTLRS
jgi:hypothetical protein